MILSLFEPRKGDRYTEESVESSTHRGRVLPAWPLYTLLYGYPLLWVLGLGQFAPTILAFVMIFYMVLYKEIIIFKSQWIWFVLTIWCIVCTVSLHGGSDILAWGIRFLVIFNAGVYSVYYFNARERITIQSVLGGLVTLWYTIVVLGWLAMFFPEFRVATPMSFLIPEGLQQNPLVKDYVHPPLAEVQMPWGAPEPYVRPAAPFPYANSWGLAFTFLTPVVVAVISATKRTRTKIILGLSIGAGIVPAIETSNRGMFIGLALCIAYVIFRQVLNGNLRLAVYAVVTTLVVIWGLYASGAVAKILGRQEYSDSTGTRSLLYEHTWQAVLKSPVIGYGTARPDYEVGISMGTQGYLWALMFCFGLVGLGLFISFILYSLLATWNIQSDAGYWLHGVVVAACFVFTIYSFDTMQMASLMLCLAMLMRSTVYREGL